MSKPLAGISVALPILALGVLGLSAPKLVAILLTIAYVTTGPLQILLALLILFTVTGLIE